MFKSYLATYSNEYSFTLPSTMVHSSFKFGFWSATQGDDQTSEKLGIIDLYRDLVN